ncbi:hypothetical protein V8C37DRAFT_381550 [Trichoderma ceciliae]
MDTNSKVVAELVETSISIPSQQYKDVYNKSMQPILLAQPGIVLAMAGVIIAGTDQVETQEDSATVISLVIWENVEAHIAFVTGDAAIPFFEASKPLMSAPPSIEHYEIGGLQSPAFESRYAHVMKASSANDKELLAKIHEKHAAAQGTGMTVLSECVEDASQRTLILFSNSDEFEAAADAAGGDANIRSYTVMWYSGGMKSAH